MAKMIVIKNTAQGSVIVNGVSLEPGETRAVDERLAKRLLKERPKDLARASGEEKENALSALESEALEVEPITAEELAARERRMRESPAFGAALGEGAATPAEAGWPEGVEAARAQQEHRASTTATAADLRSDETPAAGATKAALRSDETPVATGKKGK
jgi:hypothetical protein